MFIILFVIIHTQLHIIRYTQGGSCIQHHETESENDKIEIEKRRERKCRNRDRNGGHAYAKAHYKKSRDIMMPNAPRLRKKNEVKISKMTAFWEKFFTGIG